MSLGFPEMLFLMVFALLLFGPRKLPEIARQLGRAVAAFRSATSALQSQMQRELQQLDPDGSISAVHEIVAAPRNLIPDLKTLGLQALTDTQTARSVAVLPPPIGNSMPDSAHQLEARN
jgi:Tat protein translocase TatB subunit